MRKIAMMALLVAMLLSLGGCEISGAAGNHIDNNAAEVSANGSVSNPDDEISGQSGDADDANGAAEDGADGAASPDASDDQDGDGELASANSDNAANDDDKTTATANAAATQKDNPILIDTAGYGATDKKTVYLWSEEESCTFFVIDSATRASVYQGEATATGVTDEEKGNLLRGDFNALQTAGTYYIEAAHIGKSDSFSIATDFYETLYQEGLAAQVAMAKKKTSTLWQKMEVLDFLLSLEDLYEEDVTEEIDDITQALLTQWENAAEHPFQETDTEDGRINALYAGVMARLYTHFYSVDRTQANACYKQAEKAYQTVNSSCQAGETDMLWLFYAATELYCATGRQSYQAVMKNYDATDRNGLLGSSASVTTTSVATEDGRGVTSETLAGAYEMDFYYIKAMCRYLRTTQKVDTTLCGTYMQTLRSLAADTAEAYRELLLWESDTPMEATAFTGRFYTVTMMEYVTVSYEYVQILTEAVHYASFYEDAMDVDDAAMLLIVKEILERES